MSPGGTAKGDGKEAEEVMNGAPFVSQWSFPVTRSLSSSQELAVDGYFKAPPFIPASLSFLSVLFLIRFLVFCLSPF